MEFKQLRFFLAVADHGSFSRAAEALHVSQPTLSMQVIALEESLGSRLLLRTNKGAELTELGRVFAIYARSAIREAQKGYDEVRMIKGLEQGKVTFGLSSVFYSFIGAEAVVSFCRKHPKIRIDVNVSTHSALEVTQRLLTGEWDFGFVLDRWEHAYPKNIVCEPLIQFESGVYAAITHPLVKKRTIQLEDLNQYEWVVSQLNSIDGHLQRTFKAAELPTPKIKIVTNSFNFIRELVMTDNMLCMLPHYFVRREIRANTIRLIKQRYLSVRAAAGVVYSSDRELTPAAAAAISSFRKICASTKVS